MLSWRCFCYYLFKIWDSKPSNIIVTTTTTIMMIIIIIIIILVSHPIKDQFNCFWCHLSFLFFHTTSNAMLKIDTRCHYWFPSRCYPRSKSCSSVCTVLIKQLWSSMYLYWYGNSFCKTTCAGFTRTHDKKLPYRCLKHLVSCSNPGYSTLSSLPSLVFLFCQRAQLCLPDVHGHDHLADVAAAGSTCRCRRLHQEHAIGGQRGADVLQVNALGQPERHKRKETSSQPGAHFAQLSVFVMFVLLECSSRSWFCRRPTCISEWSILKPPRAYPAFHHDSLLNQNCEMHFLFLANLQQQWKLSFSK